MAAEVAEHAALEDVLELGPVFGSESGGLVEADLSCVALGENTIEHNGVEVEVSVEGGAEAMNERERAKLSIVRCTRAPTVQGRAHGSNEDAQHGAGDVRVRLEEGAQPLRHAQHPLPDGKLREHMLGDVGGDFCHTARIA